MAEEEKDIRLPVSDAAEMGNEVPGEPVSPVNQVVPKDEGQDFFTLKKKELPPDEPPVETKGRKKFRQPEEELAAPSGKVTKAAKEYYLNMIKVIAGLIAGLIGITILMIGGCSYYLISRVIDDPRHGVTIHKAAEKIDAAGWSIGKIIDISMDALDKLREPPAETAETDRKEQK